MSVKVFHLIKISERIGLNVIFLNRVYDVIDFARAAK